MGREYRLPPDPGRTASSIWPDVIYGRHNDGDGEFDRFFLRASKRATAIATLNRQRHLTPSCGGSTPTAERTAGPARMSLESLTPRPGIREQYRHFSDMA